MKQRIWILGAILATLATSPPARAYQLTDPIPQPIPQSTIGVKLRPIATGLTSPIALTIAGDGTDRKFVVDQTGKVLLLKGGQLASQPFLDISSTLSQLSPAFPGAPNGVNPGYDERGLLGLAFHPGFSDPTSAGYLTLYTMSNAPVTTTADFPSANITPNSQEVITEWKVSATNPDVVDAGSQRELLRFDKPQFNHNGGTLAFGKDGLLYASIGDGGNANDVGPGHNPATGNGQDLSTVLGKILRIDPLNPALTSGSSNPISANGKYRIPSDNPHVGTPGAVGEVFASGFRNPYRMSFDVVDGRLIVADVGQAQIEEIDVITKGGNYGWHTKEGSFLFNPQNATVSTDPNPDPNLINPVAEYDHDNHYLAVVGGFVYHGTKIPELDGKYIFADLTGTLFDADLTTGRIEKLLDLGNFFIKGFGQDAQNELYVMGSSNIGPDGTGGVIFAIGAVPEPASVVLLGLGATALLAWRSRMNRRSRQRETATPIA